jgi:hypothetical protein
VTLHIQLHAEVITISVLFCFVLFFSKGDNQSEKEPLRSRTPITFEKSHSKEGQNVTCGGGSWGMG